MEELFGIPKKVMMFDDLTKIKEELDGPMGLIPFFFVFEIMFCEYEGVTFCVMSGTNS